VNAEPVTELPARRVTRRVAAVLVAGALTLTSACAAGQVAQTANQKPTIDGTEANVGDIGLRGLAIVAPTSNFYPVGSSARVRVVVVNSGEQGDRLTGISSSSIAGWRSFNNALAAAANVGGVRVAPIAAGGRLSYGVPESRSVLVLQGLKSKLFPGNSLRLTFTFARAGSITIPVPVQVSRTPGSSVVPEPGASGENG
jgi:hypothetical protein